MTDFNHERREDEVQRPSLSADELLNLYQHGRRDFAKLDLQGLRLCEALLRGCDFEGVELSEADLTNAIMNRCDLSKAALQHTVLCGAVLRGANLSEADLRGANLTGANLSGADLRGTDFREATLAECILTDTLRDATTDFSGLDLSQAVCDPDTGHEILRGMTLRDQFDVCADFIGNLMAYSVCTFLGMSLGGVIGMSVGVILLWPFGIDGTTAGFGAGATLAAIICVRNFVLFPRPAENEDPMLE